MLEYVFMQRGLLVGFLLGIAVPLVGVTIVLKRLSMIGDALSHTSLAGVAGGLVAGASPVAGAIVACVGGALCIEGIRRKFKDQSELAVAVVMATGIGLAGVLSGFVPNASSFNSFMFGSILTVTEGEVLSIVVVSVVSVALCVTLRRELFSCPSTRGTHVWSGCRWAPRTSSLSWSWRWWLPSRRAPWARSSCRP